MQITRDKDRAASNVNISSGFSHRNQELPDKSDGNLRNPFFIKQEIENAKIQGLQSFSL